MKDDVRFIRKNGRIIPIRKKNKENEEFKKAAKITGAGLGISAIGGYGAGKVLKRADRHSQMSFDFMNEKRGSRLPKGTKSIFEGMKKARVGLNNAKKLSALSRVLGTGLAFAGVNKIIKNKEDSQIKEAAKVFTAAVVSDVGVRALHQGARVSTRMGYGKKSMKAGKELLKAVIKRKL